MRKATFFWICLMACSSEERRVEVPSVPVPEPLVNERSRVAITPTVLEKRRGERAYTLLAFEMGASDVQFEFVDLSFRDSLRSALTERALVVVNGGFWQPGGEPEGLAFDRGGQQVAFEPDLGGGVFVVSGGRAELFDGETFMLRQLEGREVDFAIQAKPRVLVEGAINIQRDDERYADRTALCYLASNQAIGSGDRVALIVARGEDPTGRGGPSLFEFAEDVISVGCHEALNLDGGPSTGVVFRGVNDVEALEPRTRIRLAVRVSSARSY